MDQNNFNKNESESERDDNLVADAPVSFEEKDVERKKRAPKKVSVGMTIVLVLLAALIAFQTTYIALTSSYKVKLNKAYDNVSKFAAIFEAYEIFDENYIYQINDKNLVDIMLLTFASQDKYFSYYTAEEWIEMNNTHQGVSYGIGVYVSEGSEGILVAHVMKDSPAYIAGLKYNDCIVEIDGVSVKSVGYENAVDLVSGEAGTIVNITVIRDGEKKVIPVRRGEYTAETVLYETIVSDTGKKVGYIRILEFYSVTVSQFKNAVNALISDGCESLVFDVRDNPGGELSAILSILDFLLPEGPIVHILDADKKEIDRYDSDKNEIDMPMAVLANENTASAAELFTSALRDYDKAKIVGTKTYGKGCGQNAYALSNGGYIYVTSFFYNPPFGKNYDGIGIYPNIEIQLSEKYKDKNLFFVPHEDDAQIKAAIRSFEN